MRNEASPESVRPVIHPVIHENMRFFSFVQKVPLFFAKEHQSFLKSPPPATPSPPPCFEKARLIFMMCKVGLSSS